ncbi:MAG: hypothetical protein IKU67_05700 [Firmicutes bacterium]|nr:hypothetical protein [Bacillota bacterium]
MSENDVKVMNGEVTEAEQMTAVTPVNPEVKKTWKQKHDEKKLAKAKRKLERQTLEVQKMEHPEDAALAEKLKVMKHEDLVALGKRLGIVAAGTMGTLTLIGVIVKVLSGKSTDDTVDVTFSETGDSFTVSESE